MVPGTRILRFSSWDALFVLMAAFHGLVLMHAPPFPLIAIGMWWTANTISHNFIHRPFFGFRPLNVLFSLCLTALLGVPHALWRDRHLAHHGGRAWHLRLAPQLRAELALVCGLWTALATLQPRFFISAYVPGYLAGLGLCALQGYFEHARGTTSHYGRLYNLLCFNDGYHVEHHASPGIHWRMLPGRIDPRARASRWPPLFRWLDKDTGCDFSFLAMWQKTKNHTRCLETLERLVLRSPLLQRFVLSSHRRALAQLLPQVGSVRRVAIVGGGLFPRTALILQGLVPAARLVIIDADARNLETARAILGEGAQFVHRRYAATGESDDFDLVVIPLSFQGRRAAIYRELPAKAVLVHDWIWRPHGTSRIVSVVLLKRMNLVRSGRALGRGPRSRNFVLCV